jgi:hypothetical protein
MGYLGWSKERWRSEAGQVNGLAGGFPAGKS